MDNNQLNVISNELALQIDKAGVIAVIVIDEVDNAVPLARALLAGGVNAIELTLRTEAAIAAAEKIKVNVPEMLLGFGTVITEDQVKAVVDVGADFAVAPGCNPKIISTAVSHGLSFAPGVMTPTDIEMALAEGCRILKFFPAKTTGGMAHLKSMSAPYNYLDLKFIPLGGVNIGNAQSYLESPLITAIGGSWLAKRNLINQKDWDTITKNASEITSLIKKLRQ